MPRKKPLHKKDNSDQKQPPRPTSLKQLAAHLGLSPTTLSLVLNDAAGASSIPQQTKDRIIEAAREFNYQPHFIARSLRAQRTYTVGVMIPEMSEGYSAMVLCGIEDFLLKEGYFYFAASHRHRPELIAKYPQFFLDRRVEGLIAVDTPQTQPSPLPVVSVSGHYDVEGITNIVLDHQLAARLALEYLVNQGHQKIAVIKGQAFSSDTQIRWASIRDEAARLSIPIPAALVAQLKGDSPSPETGYLATQKLLKSGQPFTALFAFNDISAIGSIRALREVGLRVPEDISVIGFDDVHAAAFHNPALTTIRQPLRKMGELAAEQLLRRIVNGSGAPFPEIVVVEPELIVRESTGPANAPASSRRRSR